MSRFTIIESPFSGDQEGNLQYARTAANDSFNRGEIPYASHMFFPQFLDDDSEVERDQGIRAGFELALALHAGASVTVAFYVDKGWSRGMEAAMDYYTEHGLHCETRRLDEASMPAEESRTDDVRNRQSMEQSRH